MGYTNGWGSSASVSIVRGLNDQESAKRHVGRGTLLDRSQVSTTGVVMSTYVPQGDIQPGSFASTEPSEQELARRKKVANERQ